MNILNYFSYIYNYKLKPILYLKNYNSKKFNYNWEASNGERIEIINNLIKKCSGENYLEIGCDKDIVFNAVKCKNKVGVDPNSGGNIRDTSDNFFLKNKKNFDVIFIDGLHHFDQILRDFKNSFKYLNQNGYIVMHDLMPRNWLEEHVPRISNNWCGDVWKISFLLNNINHHHYNLILTDFGLGVFQKKNNFLKINDKDISNKKFDYYVKKHDDLPTIDKSEFYIKFNLI